MSILKTSIRVVCVGISMMLLSSCSSYKSSFSCGDAAGVHCTSMDCVDRLISSGEIEQYHNKARLKGAHKKWKKSKGNAAKRSIAHENMDLPRVKTPRVKSQGLKTPRVKASLVKPLHGGV